MAAVATVLHSISGVSANFPVASCTENALRSAVASAASGDTIDLSICAQSTITLTTGALIVNQHDLAFSGAQGATISGGKASAVVISGNTGTISFTNLSIKDGFAKASSTISGGCISTYGSVVLSHSLVSGCSAISNNNGAYGGGIYAAGTVSLDSSVVTGNYTKAPGLAEGGGIFSIGGVSATFSEIVGNNALGQTGIAGGIYSSGTTNIRYSTIASNYAQTAGGGVAAFTPNTILIANSTIAENHAGSSGGGVMLTSAQIPAAVISNCTVAGNGANDSGGALFQNNGKANVISSIFAENFAPLYSNFFANQSANPAALIGGAHNLIDNDTNSTNVPFPQTFAIVGDPQLGDLEWNGGPTRTRAIPPGSAAIGGGVTNINDLRFDQRGKGHPRTSSGSMDIGAVQSEPLFADDFE